MRSRAIVTVITRNYAHFALALAESAQAQHPDCDFYVCFADEPPTKWSAGSTHAKLFYARDLAIPAWRRFAFQYTPFELSCALKPYAIQHIVSLGYEEVVYLDSDMRLYQPLTEVFEALAISSIVLTPHLMKPFPKDGGRPGENLFLMAGTFNGGFLAVRNSQTSTEFLDWWRSKLEKEGHKDLAGSIYVDQKWLSLVPGLFEDVFIMRNPAYNTGHWTLPQFEISTDTTGHMTIGGHPVVLFHFSNFGPNNPHEFLNCQNRMTLDELPQLKAILSEYHAAVARHNVGNISGWGCEFDKLDDGTAIHPGWREAIRRDHPLLADVADPFRCLANPGLKDKFAAVQAEAHKWRKDWRLKGFPNADAQNRIKKAKGRVKSWLSKVGLRKKAA